VGISLTGEGHHIERGRWSNGDATVVGAEQNDDLHQLRHGVHLSDPARCHRREIFDRAQIRAVVLGE
jgi:hypothetical protein